VTAATFHLLRERLRNQSLAVSRLRTPGEVVAWLGAAQAQDYAGAKWALGLRAKGVTDAAVDQAFDEGAILRTHILRPTWHFIARGDIRWMLALSGPRVHAVNAYYYRTLGLDAAVFARSRAALERALAGGRQLTRVELAKVLQRAGVQADGPRLAYVMMHAELDAVICSGARRGKQFTYALLEERAPRAKVWPRDEALAELTRRYFSSHGPATLRDYVWWSGLTARDARAGMAMSSLAQTTIDDRSYWFVPGRARVPSASASAHLLPNYDEYVIAYKDREPVVGSTRGIDARVPDVFSHSLVVNGVLAGSWRRTASRDAVAVEVTPYIRLTASGTRALAVAAERLGRFLNVPAKLVIVRRAPL
jgi:hypothetical protein